MLEMCDSSGIFSMNPHNMSHDVEISKVLPVEISFKNQSRSGLRFCFYRLSISPKAAPVGRIVVTLLKKAVFQ